MDFKTMTVDELLERRTQIATEVETDGADLNALEEEVRAINEEIETRKADEEKRKEIRSAVANGIGTVVEKKEEERKMENKEIRNTPEYREAFANYIKTGSDKECRALLTENVASGTVPVPELVHDVVKHAWEKLGILELVQTTSVKGNLKVAVETAAGSAVAHTEGAEAINEESLTLATVDIVPVSYKKWKGLSDEVIDMSSDAFLTYIYEELTYRIGKALEDAIVTAIAGMDDDDDVPVAELAAAPALGTIASAMSLLSDEANDLTIVMNKATWGQFKAAQYNGNFAADPFEGLRVVFNNSLDAYADTDAGDVYAIVGDFNYGVQVNFPNGNGITIKKDELTLMTSDIVRFLGRLYAGFGVVAPNAFCVVSRPSA